MRNDGIGEVETFRCLGLKSHAFRGDAEQFGHAPPDRGRVRSDLRCYQNQAAIKIADVVSLSPCSRKRFVQKDDGIRSLPSRVRGWEQSTDVGCSDRTQQRVRDGMQQDVSIGVAAQALIVRQHDAPDLQWNSGEEFVGVESVADSVCWFPVLRLWLLLPGLWHEWGAIF